MTRSTNCNEHRAATALSRNLATVLLLVAASSLPAGAQETDGQIRGIVRDTAGRPVAEQRIELRRPRREGRGQAVAISDANGAFAFTELALGGYEVEWVSEGRILASSGPVKLSTETQRVTNVTLVHPLPLSEEIGPGVARSLDQLQLLVRRGDAATLIDAAGAQLVGRIDELSPSSLSLAMRGSRRDFREDDVVTIRQRRGDPLRDGAWKGFAIGASSGAFALLATCGAIGNACQLGLLTAVIGTYGAMGAGVAVDAAVRHEQLIYYRRPVVSSGRIRITPQLGTSRQGVVVHLRR